MTNKFIWTLALLASLCLAPWIGAQGISKWHSDARSAFDEAERAGSPVLMLLRVEADGDTDLAVKTSAAATHLSDFLVGAELVYPEQAYAQTAIAQEIVGWSDVVGATQLPALAWLGPDGRPYGIIQLAESQDAEQFQQQLARMGHRYYLSQAAFAEAAQLAGSDRAEKLHQGLQLVDEPCRGSYHDVMQQIVELDPENVLSLKARYEPILTEVLINEVIQGEVYPLVDAGAYQDARAALDRLIQHYPVSVEQRQLLMAFQAQLLYSQNRSKEALAVLDEAISITSESSVYEKLVATRLQFMAP